MNIGHVNTPIAAESLALTGAPERCTGADMIWDTMRPNVSDTNRKECPQLKFVLNVTVIQVRCVLIKTAFVVFLLFVQFGGFLFKIHQQKALDEAEFFEEHISLSRGGKTFSSLLDAKRRLMSG